MYEPELREFFLEDDCDRCGECLSKCPELAHRISDPVDTIQKIINGEYVKEILEHCSSCMSCNVLCPNNCNPYGLFLYRWHQREREKGLPMRASLVMPLEPGNAWHRVMDGLPVDESNLLTTWSDLNRPELKGKAMFAGCNLQILPYLSKSSIFGGLPVFGRPDLCCGEVYYRMGVLSKVESNTRSLENTYKELEIRELIAYCQACYNILKNILPNYFDAHFPFEVSYFGDILYDKVMSGEFHVKDKVRGLKVTLHDPCHSKLLGREFQQRPREILEYMGCEITEMRNTHEMSLCCGLGHGAGRHNPIDMAFGIMRRLRQAKSTGSEYLVVYCNSCDLLFSVGTQVTPFIIPIYHLNELVSRAIGEELPRLNLKRARSMINHLFIKGAPKIISTQRFRVQ